MTSSMFITIYKKADQKNAPAVGGASKSVCSLLLYNDEHFFVELLLHKISNLRSTVVDVRISST
jgi:hypothetical protein